MEKAALYDYARMCKFYDDCKECPLENYRSETFIACDYLVRTVTDKANEIILKWCKEHPVETRQDRFLKMFPNAQRLDDGTLRVCPKVIDKKLLDINCDNRLCEECYRGYWLAEVDE